MAEELKYFRMEIHLKDNLNRESHQDLEFTNGRMVLFIKDSLKMAIGLEKA